MMLVTTQVGDTECRELACQTRVVEKRGLFEQYIVQCSLDCSAEDESGEFRVERSGLVQSGSEELGEPLPSSASDLADGLMLAKVRNGSQKDAI